MSDKLKRAMARGAETTVVPKQVHLQGLGDLVEQLRMMAEAQQRSQQIIVESINNIVAAITEKELKSTDVSQLTRAVLSLKQDVVTESNTPMDYQVDFDRDSRTGLMKSGIRFTAIPKVLN